MAEKVSFQVGAGNITIETGKLAKQADGAVTVQLGETIVLVAAVAATNAKPGQDFFPLTVDYREKAAAAGKFPGGYFKREGRPTEKEILTSRLIDRPIRPLFPKGWYNEVQVQSILLSADGENDPDIIGIIGASAALTVSDIPWEGPLGAVRVGRVGGQFIANPTHAQMAESDLDLIYVGNKRDIVMYEGSANEISEADFNAALVFAQEACQPIIAAQEELAKAGGKKKRQITINVVPDDILEAAKKLAGDRMVPALLTPGKLARESAVKAVTEEVGKKLVEKFGEEKVTEFVLKDTFYYIQKEAVRKLIMKDGKRLDGRDFDTVRSIVSEAGLIPRVHGSALFSRGETQALVLATLGTTEESQEFDSYTGGATEKQFILHYNFPNFSVGETGRISGPGRREIGHGALAERSIEPMVPVKEFPYAIRLTCEIMESNGSTSMASVCGGSLALMDAGVPLKKPVGGISVGICTVTDDKNNINDYRLLTDIIGWEDAFCDMDCKLAGTPDGLTGFQLDLKLRGIPHKIMSEAVEKARVARLHVLQEMAKALPAPRTELSKYAPRIITLKINPEKIGALIGPGGKNIKKIVEESGCEINIEDDGTVHIYSVSPEGMEIAKEAIQGATGEIEVGKVYRGRVVSIKEFGCFVEVMPGKEGLVHVSELANFRVKMVEDIVKVGDEIWVKCIGIDEKGRVKLSRRAAMEDRDREMSGGEKPAGEAAPEGEERPERPESTEGRGGERGRDRDRGGDFGRSEGRGESRGGMRDSGRGERRDFGRGEGRPEGRGEARGGESRGGMRDSGRGERSDRGGADRDRGERSDRGGERDRGERTVADRGADRGVSRGERSDRGGDRGGEFRSERTDRGDRVESRDRGESRGDTRERSDRPEPRGEIRERGDRPEARGESRDRGDRGEYRERSDRPERGESRERSDRGEPRPEPRDRGSESRGSESRGSESRSGGTRERESNEPRETREPRESRGPRESGGDRGYRD